MSNFALVFAGCPKDFWPGLYIELFKAKNAGITSFVGYLTWVPEVFMRSFRCHVSHVSVSNVDRQWFWKNYSFHSVEYNDSFHLIFAEYDNRFHLLTSLCSVS